jgi:hypothetical protein
MARSRELIGEERNRVDVIRRQHGAFL